METAESEIKKLESDIVELIDKLLEESNPLLGINIGTHGGTLIASKHRKGTKLTEVEIASATSSLIFLSSKILHDSLNQKISYNLITGKEVVLISMLTENITLIAYLNRELAELEGLKSHIVKLETFTLKISAIIETSEIIREEVFVAVKRAIPKALVIAIITKEGLPIKIQSTMPEPMISAMISAIYNLCTVLIEGNLEYSIIAGENGSIIIHKLDENRILCVAVPEGEERKLAIYIAKIKAIIS